MVDSALTRDWFRDWFGEEYLALYPHRDQMEARDAVRLFLSVIPPHPGYPVLDVACGAGRHLRELVSRGVRTMGLDLSRTLLRSAREAAPSHHLVCGDMRLLPLRDGVFGACTSFFTSFGYFDDPADDERVLAELARVLCPEGTFMIDFLNADRVRSELVPEDVQDTESGRIVQRRQIVGDRVVKSISIETRGEGAVRTFYERVRLYDRERLEGLLAGAGLVTTHRFGDYKGSPAGRTAPRLILAGRRSQKGGDRS